VATNVYCDSQRMMQARGKSLNWYAMERLSRSAKCPN
jgi:hypothetical protein